MCIKFVVYLINIGLKCCCFHGGFLCLLFFSFFLSLFFFWFRHAWCLSSHCSVFTCPPLGWHKCQLPSATPEHSSCGSPGLPLAPGQREKESTGCHSAGRALRVSHTVHPGRQRPARWAGTSQASPPQGAPVPHPVQKRKTCDGSTCWCGSVGVAHRSKTTPQEDRSSTSCLAASSSLQGTPADLYQPSWTCPVQVLALSPGPKLVEFQTKTAHLQYQKPATTLQLCSEAALELHMGPRKQRVAYFSASPSQAGLASACHQPLTLPLLVVVGLQLRHTVIKGLLEWKITPHTCKRRFTQGRPTKPGTRWAQNI